MSRRARVPDPVETPNKITVQLGQMWLGQETGHSAEETGRSALSTKSHRRRSA